MTFEKWGYDFEGVFYSPDNLRSEPGVYVIWCEVGGNRIVLDVGESDDVKDRVKNHERAYSWHDNCMTKILYSATYTSNLQETERREIEQRIRRLEKVVCDKR